jgi:hypothetical protein
VPCKPPVVSWANRYTPDSNKAIVTSKAKSLLDVVNRISCLLEIVNVTRKSGSSALAASWEQSRDPTHCKAFGPFKVFVRAGIPTKHLPLVLPVFAGLLAKHLHETNAYTHK